MILQMTLRDGLCNHKHSHPPGNFSFSLRPSTHGGCRGLGRPYSRRVLQGPSGKRLECHRYKPVRTMAQAVGLGSALPLTEGWVLWALLAISASFAQVLQTQTQVGRLLSAPLLAILLGLALSGAGIIPFDCPAYGRITGYLLPLAAALYLLESDLKELASTARDTVVAFLAATLGTVIGTVAAWQAVGYLLGPDGWKVAAALCGSYVGGSVNFAAVSAALGLPPGPLLAAAMSADMVAMAGYLAIISSWPVTEREQAAIGQQGDPALKEDSLSMSLAAAMLACALGTCLAELVGIPGFSLGLVAIFASGFASLGVAVNSSFSGGKTTSPFQGAEALGGALMSYFFVTIGAAAGSVGAVLQTGWLTGFIAIQLAIHLAVTVGLGCLLRLPMQAILTASNAAIGGPATAASMAGARQWTQEIRPALIVGALGYSIGTGIGISVGHFLHPV